jgi:peptidoglycan hydrolase-like amidase
MEKLHPRRKKRFVPGAFKFLVAVSSLAGTIGIWNALANKDLVQANAQNLENTPTTEILDPLPTVAPLIIVDLSSLNRINPISTPATLKEVNVSVSAPNPPSSPAVINSGNSSAPAPVTVTQSSKK